MAKQEEEMLAWRKRMRKRTKKDRALLALSPPSSLSSLSPSSLSSSPIQFPIQNKQLWYFCHCSSFICYWSSFPKDNLHTHMCFHCSHSINFLGGCQPYNTPSHGLWNQIDSHFSTESTELLMMNFMARIFQIGHNWLKWLKIWMTDYPAPGGEVRNWAGKPFGNAGCQIQWTGSFVLMREM